MILAKVEGRVIHIGYVSGLYTRVLQMEVMRIVKIFDIKTKIFLNSLALAVKEC